MILHYVLQYDGSEAIGLLKKRNSRYVVLTPWIRTGQLAEALLINLTNVEKIRRVKVNIER
jgi:hypothetical protein